MYVQAYLVNKIIFRNKIFMFAVSMSSQQIFIVVFSGFFFLNFSPEIGGFTLS